MNPGERANGSLLVSIVDDDASMRTSTRRLLGTFGFRAEAFASAQAFLDSGRLEDTACLILDVRMPGMGGLELQRRLARNHQLPIIFVTAHASLEEEARAMQAGAIAFLRKPVSPQELLSALRAAEAAPRRGGQDADESRSPES